MRPVTSLLSLFAALLAFAAYALTFPALTGRVVDEAGIIDIDTRAALTQSLADLEAKTTDQLVVVTVRSLQGTSIEDYGYQLGRHWQIGQKDKNNGALLIVAPNERKLRIEVGYGLEPTLTDAISRWIIANSILPRFKANDFNGGIRRGVEDIIQVLSGDAEEWKQRAAGPKHDLLLDDILPIIFFLLIASFIIFNFVLPLLGVSRGRRRSRGGWYIPAGDSSWSGGSSWSSGSSGGFSGGGGSFGGGGSSGSW